MAIMDINTTSDHSTKPHAIMISYPLQGHIIPYVNLALKLASHGFSITFAHPEHVHHSISQSRDNASTPDIFAKARASGLDISYTTIFDGFPVEFDRPGNLFQYLKSLTEEFPDCVDAFVKKVILARSSSCSSRFFLIADSFYEWPVEIARRNNLVNVSFMSEPALVYSLYYHRELLKENGHVPVNGRHENVSYLPGIESINTKDFMSHYYLEPDFIGETIFRALDTAKKADFLLCNSVEDLEKENVSALRENQPFYAIGPLLSLHFGESSVPRSLLPESDCTEWLKGKPIGSVLYVSFGSLARIDKAVILEISSGLLHSEVNFIWVLRPGIVDSDSTKSILPPGFEDRIKDKGVVVPWCDQSRVLSDPAIGGFLTHCGWNSILESIWCSVPMLCYHVFTDQPTNRKLVVDDWRIGMNLCDGEDVTGEEIVEKIRSLMSVERSYGLKQEIRKVREQMQNALAEDGCSAKNFDCFVHDLVAEVDKRCRESELSI